MHTVKPLKKIILYFHITKKISKRYISMHLALITSLLKSRQLGQYFKNFKKIILFSF